MKKILVVLVVGAMLSGFTGGASATPIQWVGSGANNNWYELVDAPNTTWTDANTAASSMTYNGLTGHLATLTSIEENEFVFTGLQIDKRPAWLGGFQDEKAGEPDQDWQWVTGETWDWTNFTPNEPSNSSWGDEDALSFSQWKGDGTWNDAPTLYDLYNNGTYVVEYESAPVPEPATMLLFGTGFLSLIGFNRKRFSKNN